MDYTVNINDFHGPMDLLLHLVKTAKMDIYEINTSIIIEGYLNFIKKMQDLNIDIASEFLVMAATLVHLKSKLLIGIKDELDNNEELEYDINTEDDLKKRIIEYDKYKNMSEIFKKLEDKRSDFYTKSPESLAEYTNTTCVSNGNVTIDDLVDAFLAYQERINMQKPLQTKITKKEISIEERISHIKKILSFQKKVNFIELFTTVSKDFVVATFLAILQMAKNQEIKLIQEDNFQNIVVESR